jgi:hypothetical protein
VNKEHIILGALQATAGLAAWAAQDENVLSSGNSRALYLAGSIGGALLTMMIFPQAEIDPSIEETDKKKYARLKRRANQRFLAKGLSSLIGGGLFTPVLMRWSGIDLTEDRILAFSAVTAMFIVSAIHTISPKAEAFIDAWSDSMANKYKPKDGQ